MALACAVTANVREGETFAMRDEMLSIGGREWVCVHRSGWNDALCTLRSGQAGAFVGLPPNRGKRNAENHAIM